DFSCGHSSNQWSAAAQFCGRHPTRKQPSGVPPRDDRQRQNFLWHPSPLRGRFPPFNPLYPRGILVLVVIQKSFIVLIESMTTATDEPMPRPGQSPAPAIKVGILPLFSTWIYQCDTGLVHFNEPLEQLAAKLRADSRNAT